MLNINPEHYDFSNNPTVEQLVQSLKISPLFSNSEAELFVDFPLYKGMDDNLIISQLIIVSQLFGVFAIYATDKNQYDPEAFVNVTIP